MLHNLANSNNGKYSISFILNHHNIGRSRIQDPFHKFHFGTHIHNNNINKTQIFLQ